MLGGGLGAMTTAYWLTNQDGWDDEYEVTVYQMGWRLGGKGASGRDMRPGFGHRIQEHGLHIWFGFYDNAFHMMRDALAKLHAMPEPPVATFPDVQHAFTPQSLITLEEEYGGAWEHWPLLFPTNGDTPGTGGEINLWDALVDMLGWLQELLDQFLDGRPKHAAGLAPRPEHTVPHWVEKLLGGAERAEATLLHRAVAIARAMHTDPSVHATEHHSLLADLIRAFLDGLWLLVCDDLDDTFVRRLWLIMDLGGTTAVGVLRERLLVVGFEAADVYDYMEWLGVHGAKPITQTSAPVMAIYDLVFGFDRGDTTKPNFAAGTCTRGVLRMLFTYKGALMFKMMAGMGDTIFTPFYGALRARGVKFEWFHRVDELELTPDRTRVGRIRMGVQVNLTEQARRDGYWPLVRVAGLDCWPQDPLWDQLEDADKLQHDPYNPGHPYDLESYYTSWKDVGSKVLEVGKDFDLVVLGISVGALPTLCGELVAANQDWAAMVSKVATVRTQGVQLWLTPTVEQLGWKIPDWAAGDPSKGLDPVLGAYAQALDTWADMSHLLPVEDWPEKYEPGSVAYFCGPFTDGPEPHAFTDHALPRRELDRCIREGLQWFDRNLGYVWPNGTSPQHPTGVNPALLVDPGDGQGRDRFLAQWWRVNVDPTERYTLSVKGSTAARLRPDRSGFTNLYLAGDWTWNGVLNAGCVEATVASGMHASRAICGRPERIVGESE